MIIELLLLVLIGSIVGTLLGLIPGIHPNMIILFAPVFASLATTPAGVYYSVVFIVGMGVANSFSSFIPAIYLGASEDAEMFSSYPGHKMLLAGRGHEAVVLTVIGGVMSVIIAAALIPIIVYVIPTVYSASRQYVWIFLVLIVGYLILSL